MTTFPDKLEETIRAMWRNSGMSGDLNIEDDEDKLDEAKATIIALIETEVVGVMDDHISARRIGIASNPVRARNNLRQEQLKIIHGDKS